MNRGSESAGQARRYQIRPATPDDVPVVLKLIRDLAAYERLLDSVVATEASLRDSLFGPRPAAEALLAELEDRPVGYAIFFPSFSSFVGRPGIYLEDIYVQPEARGQGIGKALFLRVADLAVERRCGRLEWAVLDWNEPSIRFYESLGAQPLSDWTLYRLSGAALEKLADDRV
jgi:GNAT superfamily N-acetyltransferase